jgi:hypothetical protein
MRAIALNTKANTGLPRTLQGKSEFRANRTLESRTNPIFEFLDVGETVSVCGDYSAVDIYVNTLEDAAFYNRTPEIRRCEKAWTLEEERMMGADPYA